MINRILVLGGGSAGFLAAISLKIKIPDLQVTVVRSQAMGVIGVGEATTFAFPNYLHGRLKIEPGEFHRQAQPTWKLGIRFLNWSPRRHFDYTFRPQVTSRWEDLPKPNGYYCYEDFEYADAFPALMSHDKAFMRNRYGGPHIGTDVAYHIENKTFVAYLEGYAARLGIVIHDDVATEIKQDDAGVTGLVLKSGRTETADLYIDCSGFASVLLQKTLREPYISFKPSLFCDRAIWGGWERAPQPSEPAAQAAAGSGEPIKPYTTAEAMDAGWCWRIDHEFLINRGYVYCSAFLSDEDAEREFRAKNPKVQTTKPVKFVTGRHERAWVKNVVGIGNAAGFVEPLESTSLGVICDGSDSLVNSLLECDRRPTPTVVRQYNKRFGIKWDNIRGFLAVHYKFNTGMDTPFWRECRASCDLGPAAEIVEYYRENGPGSYHAQTLLGRLSQFGLEGYWALLLGQKVPYEPLYVPSEQEREKWRRIQQAFKAKAEAGVSVKEALTLVRSPQFQWPPTLYTEQLFEQSF
jgi:tryptophan halogenase